MDSSLARYPQGLEFEDSPNCIVCRASVAHAAVVLADVPDLDVPSAPTFAIVTCPECGVALTKPTPTESTIDLLYREGTSSDYEYPESGPIGRLKDTFAQMRVRKIVKALSSAPTTILDYGTGGGRFASAAASVVKDGLVFGTDFADRPPSQSYYHSDSRLTYLPYATLKDSPRRYDLIIARHVLEHMHHPIDFIRSLLNLLSENGAIYIEVPNFASRTAKILGSDWPLLYLPKHLSHFTRETLRKTIERAGATATIASCEMPMMGNVVAMKLGRSRFDPIFRPAALLLHPIQILLEAASNEGTCLYAVVSKA